MGGRRGSTQVPAGGRVEMKNNDYNISKLMHRLRRGGSVFLLTLTVRPLSCASSSSSSVASFVNAIPHSRLGVLLPSIITLRYSSLLPQQQQQQHLSSMSGVTNPYSNTSGIIHADASLVEGCEFDITRTRLLTPRVPIPPKTKTRCNGKPENNTFGVASGGTPCVVYWMIRDVRTADNWALLFAQNIAKKIGLPLRVVYALPPPPDDREAATAEGEDGSPPPKPSDMAPTARHGKFLLDGLKVVSNEFEERGVPFTVLHARRGRDNVGYDVFQDYCLSPAMCDAYAVICDMSPLRHHRTWVEKQAAPSFEGAGVPFYQVDAHNVVPVWIASNKREVGARTLRPKINGVFARYCTQFPEFEGNIHNKGGTNESGDENRGPPPWEDIEEYLNLDTSIGSVDGMRGGHEMAMTRFHDFCTSKQHGLKNFDTLRNDPNYNNVCSNLSPWINAGHVSFQRLALNVRALKAHTNGTAAYIEEGVVRRELSDNFVYYTPDAYDSIDAAAGWARESLDLHASDVRDYVYTWKELEAGMTHDDLWNAAQLQLVREGKMHGFMRMYWAKKILEWTASPSYALATAQYFNDRYAYDGNDPNGFVGVGWSILGIHDMGWKERPIFGKIRYMNYAGCKRKFKIDSYVARYKGAAENAKRVSSGAAKGGGIEKFLGGKKRKA